VASLSFSSADLGETEAFLSAQYSRMSIGGHAESTRTTVMRYDAGSFNVDELAMDYDMAHQGTQPLGKVSVCFVRSGGIARRYGEGTEGSFRAGDVFMYTPHDRTYAGVIHGAQYGLLMFDPKLLSEVAASGRGESEPVRLTGDRPVSLGAARQLHRTMAHLRDHVLADPVASEMPLIVSNAARLLAATVLNTFPSNALLEPTTSDNRDAHLATARRAVAYIDAHAAEPITLADIATAAGTTIRAVQVAFRRHYNTTPTDHLRRVRLDHARRDTQVVEPTPGDKLEIAKRWGFPDAADSTPHRATNVPNPEANPMDAVDRMTLAIRDSKDIRAYTEATLAESKARIARTKAIIAEHQRPHPGTEASPEQK
jgi:AraC-like DNA-binding protein